MSHRKFEHPRHGSLGFLPRKRAARHRGKGNLVNGWSIATSIYRISYASVHTYCVCIHSTHIVRGEVIRRGHLGVWIVNKALLNF